MCNKVKKRQGYTQVSAKHQVTIPAEALSKARLRPGDWLRVVAVAPGRVTLVREDDPIQRYAGALTGLYPTGYLDEPARRVGLIVVNARVLIAVPDADDVHYVGAKDRLSQLLGEGASAAPSGDLAPADQLRHSYLQPANGMKDPEVGCAGASAIAIPG
jgi:bifunctional DNA-binding transcriptional regulator/antitoxin component of YhaV-PrlF toxin-antitoxin module